MSSHERTSYASTHKMPENPLASTRLFFWIFFLWIWTTQDNRPQGDLTAVRSILEDLTNKISKLRNSTFNSSSWGPQQTFVFAEWDKFKDIGTFYDNITASFYGEYDVGQNLSFMFPPKIKLDSNSSLENNSNSTQWQNKLGRFNWTSSGSYTLSIFSNQTLNHPDVDFLHASMRLTSNSKQVLAVDTFLTGYGIHQISTGQVYLYLIHGFNGYNFSNLLDMMPNQEVFLHAQEAIVNQLGIRLAKLEKQLQSDSSAMESTATGDASCIFQVFGQLQPVNTSRSILTKYETELRLQTGAKLISNPPPLVMNVMVHSPDCQVWLIPKSEPSRGLLLDSYFVKLNHFIAFAIFATLADLALLMKQTAYTSTPSRLLRVSAHSMGMQAVMDAYICILALTSSMVISRSFLAFISLAFLRFVLFAIFELRYVLTLSRIQDFDTNQIYARLYFLMLVALMIISQSIRSPNFVLLAAMVTYSIWIPQIVWNAYKSLRNGLIWTYLIGSSICKLSVAWFIFGIQDNAITFAIGKTYHTQLWIVTLYVALQIVIVMLQDHLGPRFFLPIATDVYDYHRMLTFDEESAIGEGTTECSICFSEVELRQDVPNDQQSLLSDVLHFRRRNVMVTPCSHIFHPDCLSHWMEQSLVCPICRASLPAR